MYKLERSDITINSISMKGVEKALSKQYKIKKPLSRIIFGDLNTDSQVILKGKTYYKISDIVNNRDLDRSKTIGIVNKFIYLTTIIEMLNLKESSYDNLPNLVKQFMSKDEKENKRIFNLIKGR